MTREAIVVSAADNVATAVRDLRAGSTVRLEVNSRCCEVVLKKDIPYGHKFATKEIGAGDPVIKYGFPIGAARFDIEPGDLVHVHNVDGKR